MLEKRPSNPVIPHGCLFFLTFVSTLGIPANRLTLVLPNELCLSLLPRQAKYAQKTNRIVFFIGGFPTGRHLHWRMGAG